MKIRNTKSNNIANFYSTRVDSVYKARNNLIFQRGTLKSVYIYPATQQIGLKEAVSPQICTQYSRQQNWIKLLNVTLFL